MKGMCSKCFETLKRKFGGRQIYVPRGRGGVNPAAVIELRRKKMTIAGIAKKLNLGNRRVYQILAEKRQGAQLGWRGRGA